MPFPRFRIGIRLKLLFLSSILFAIPWLGYKYVWEMEKYLRQGQEKTLVGTVSAVATALHERPKLFNEQASFLSNVREGRDLYALDVIDPIQLDGNIDEWKNFTHKPLYYGDDYLIEYVDSYSANSLSFNHAIAKYGNHLYVMFEVVDDYLVYRKNNSLSVHRNDNLQIALLDPDGYFQRFIIANEKPGWITAYLTKPDENSVYPLRHENKIQGNWRETAKGYNVELRIPLTMVGGKIGFAIYDVDNTLTRQTVNVVGTSNTQRSDQLGTVLVPSPEIERILKGLGHSNSRIWVIDKHRRVLARVGDIRSSSSILGDAQDEEYVGQR